MTLLDLKLLLRLDEGPRRVLVVEDAAGHYGTMVGWLGREGHEVAGFGEVHRLEDGVLVGRDLYGETAEVQVAAVEVAFLDFYFPREPWNGGRVARALVAANAAASPGVRVFGMSSVGAKNDEMVRAGAIGGMLKRELGTLIRG